MGIINVVITVSTQQHRVSNTFSPSLMLSDKNQSDQSDALKKGDFITVKVHDMSASTSDFA